MEARVHRKKRRKSVIPPWVGVLGTAALALGISLFFGATRGHYVPSDSMLPTLARGDQFRTDTFFAPKEGPRRGEIWVLTNPDPQDGNGPELVKRVIGLPGETVGVAKGKVTINGKALAEPYVAEPVKYPFKPYKIRENEYFVLGDNRNHSQDSHSWGGVPRSLFIGKVFVRYFPLQRMRLF